MKKMLVVSSGLAVLLIPPIGLLLAFPMVVLASWLEEKGR